MTGKSQAEVIEDAVNEYVRRHASELSRGVDRARRVLRPFEGPAQELSAKREEVLACAARHGARNVRVFGSVARGEADASSDIDILVDLEEGRSLFDLGALAVELEELLGRHVDVVTERGLHPRIEERVLAEAISL